MPVDIEVITAELEVVVDPAMGGEETLRMAGRFEPLHLPFSSSRGLVRHLGPVVEVAALPVFDPGQDLAFGRAVAAELVRHDHPWDVLQTAQQLAEEPPRRSGIAPALHENVEHMAVLIHGAPEVMQLAPDAD